MKLHEVLKENSKYLPKEVLQWCRHILINNGSFDINQLSLNTEGNIDCDGSFQLWNTSETPPFKFGSVAGDFIADNNYWADISFVPEYVGRSLVLSRNKNLCSLEGLRCTVGAAVTLASTGLKSLHNIHKHILHCKVLNVNNCPLQSHVLGVLLIKGLQKLNCNTLMNYRYDPPGVGNILVDALEGDRDIIAVQDKLIDCGCSNFAKI